MAWQKGVAQDVPITFYSGGVPTAPTGALTATISKDGGGFGAIGGSVAQVGATPVALLSLNTADTDCDTGVVKVTDAGGAVDDRYVEFATEANWTAAKAALIEAMRGTDNAALAATALSTAVWTAALAAHLDADISSRAVAGDAMALIADAVNDVSVEDYTKFMADVSALALEATLTAMKGAGWSDESLKAIKDALDALNDFDPATDTVARVTLVDTTTTNTDQRGTDGAALAAVWTPVIAAFIDAAISSRAVPGEKMDIVDAPNATAIAALQAGLALEATLTAIKGVGWTSADALKPIKDAIDAIGPGEGANVVDVTLNDGAGDPADGVIAVARLVGGTLARGTGTTGAGGTTGEVQFQLDDGTYEVTFGPSATYSFTNPYTLVVSGATTETFACTKLVIPTPSDPTLCVCYADLRYVDGGQLIGAEEGYLQVIAVTDDPHVWPPLAAQSALAVDDVRYQTNGSGRAQFEAVRGAGVTVRIVRPWGYGASPHEEQVSFTVPDEDTYWIPGAHS